MSDNSFEQVWDALPFPAFVVTPAGAISQANAAAEQLVSTSHKQMETKGIAQYFHKNSIIVSTLSQAVKDAGSVTQYNVDVAVNGKPVTACNLYVSFINPDSTHLLLIIQPTGVAQKMSQSLNNLSAARSVTAMAAMLAHEIRNPLAGISGAAQ